MRRLVICSVLAGCNLYFDASPPRQAVDAAAIDPDVLALPCIHTLSAGRLLPDGPDSILTTHGCTGGPVVVDAQYASGALAMVDAHADWGYQFSRTIVADVDGVPPSDVLALAAPGGPSLWAFVRAANAGPSGYGVGFARPIKDVATADVDRDGKIDLVVAGDGAIRIARGTGQLPASVAAADEQELATGKSFAYVAVAPLGGVAARDLFYLATTPAGSLELGVMIQAAASPLAFTTETFAEPAGPMLPLVVADVDGDGIADVIGATSRVFVRSSRLGGLTFLDEQAAAIAVGDLDGDGVAEVVFVTAKATAVKRVNIAPSGALSSELVVADGGGALAVADVDGDGSADIILVKERDQPASRVVVHRASARRTW